MFSKDINLLWIIRTHVLWKESVKKAVVYSIFLECEGSSGNTQLIKRNGEIQQTSRWYNSSVKDKTIKTQYTDFTSLGVLKFDYLNVISDFLS